jgi:predicted ATPase
MTVIRTPDHRLRVFVSSTLQELADERIAARDAITALHQTPVLFELGARPHPPRDLYRAYLAQSHIFIGIYWQRYGWVAPGMEISGLEDEYRLAKDCPKLIYIKAPAPDREPRLAALLDDIREEGAASYQRFTAADELRELVANDLALMLTERFEATQPRIDAPVALPDTQRSNLPAPRTSLVGREQEAAAASALLLRDDCFLLTFIGPGGAGKTRLALHVAEHLLDHFADGVFFVHLATITDPNLVIAAIGQTLHVRETVQDYLHNKEMLLVLDNFEQVVAAAPQIADLLMACPKLKILATSRTPLRVRGEKELLVAPLALPDRRNLPPLESLAQYPAIALFVQRVLDVKPDFVLTNENAAAVVELCHRLDGLPLAIELAAARIKMLSPQALLARLTQRFDALAGGARDLPDRQQTLRSTIDWSYNLLDGQSKTLFRRLAVFAGSWTPEGVAEVCNFDNALGADVFDELEALVDIHLLKRVAEIDGEPRFGMLETIRAYGLEQLATSGEETLVRQHHAIYLIGLAEEAAPYLIGAQRDIWLNRLESHLDDIRYVLQWSNTPQGDAEAGLRLAGALNWFWYLLGYLREGREWLEKLLAHPAVSSPANPGATPYRARARSGAGALAWAQGDYVTARTHLEASRELHQQLEDSRGLAYAMTFLGLVSLGQGELEAARALCTESASRLQALGDYWGEALALNWLGEITWALGDAATARIHYERSLTLFRQVGDPWGTAFPLHALAGMAWTQGDYAAAHTLFGESGALMRAVGDQWGYARSLTGSAAAALHQGNHSQARLLFEVTLSLWRELGHKAGVIRCLIGLAEIAVAEGQPARAAKLLGGADTFLQSLGIRSDGAHITNGFLLDAVDRDEFRRGLANVRAQMDENQFKAAWQQGQAMSLEQAIADALGESNPQVGNVHATSQHL